MTIHDVMRRIVAFGGLLVAALAVVGGIAGFVVAGWTGVVSALAGAAIAVAFVVLTVLSVLVGARASGGGTPRTGMLVAVLAGMLVKLAVFLLVVLASQGQTWLANGVLFATMLAAVIGSLVLDVLVVGARGRGGEEPADDETLGRPAQR